MSEQNVDTLIRQWALDARNEDGKIDPAQAAWALGHLAAQLRNPARQYYTSHAEALARALAELVAQVEERRESSRIRGLEENARYWQEKYEEATAPKKGRR